MSVPRQPHPAKLVIGLLIREKELLEDVAARLVSAYGDLEMVSPWLSFDFSDYYRKEMGSPLFRRMLVFSRLVGQQELVPVKLECNRVEDLFRRNGKRRVNVDPGILTYERFVLATGKNYTHRIYLGKGIFADLTLVYRDGGYQPLQWTYPDYAGEPIRNFLLKVRARYRLQLQAGK